MIDDCQIINRRGKGDRLAKRSKITGLCAVVFLVLAGIWLIASEARHREAEKSTVSTIFAMNTFVEFRLYGSGRERAIQEMQEALLDIERRMSLYVESSEINAINRNAGKAPVEVSQDTFELLSRCVEYGQLSEGFFDVTIAPLTEEWGITSGNAHIPDDERIHELLGLVNWQDIELDPENLSVKLAKEGQAIDVGGIAKGYACGTLRRIAEENGITSGWVSVGGNVMALGGGNPDGTPYRFGLRDPRGQENDYIAVINYADTIVATSGDYERYFEQDGVRYHHILDPFTGYPAETDLLSVSVAADDGAYADFMSTYLFIKGKDYAVEHLNDLDCGLIVIDKDKNVYISDSLMDRFTPADPDGIYHFEVGQ